MVDLGGTMIKYGGLQNNPVSCKKQQLNCNFGAVNFGIRKARKVVIKSRSFMRNRYIEIKES
jgi:hypothetical protein